MISPLLTRPTGLYLPEPGFCDETPWIHYDEVVQLGGDLKVEVHDGHYTYRMEKVPNWEHVSKYYWGQSPNNKWPRLRYQDSILWTDLSPRYRGELFMQVLRLLGKPGTEINVFKNFHIEPITVIIKPPDPW